MFSSTRNTVFPQRSPEWSFFFLKRGLIVFVWTDENGGFPKRSFLACHTAKGKGCYSISFVISFRVAGQKRLAYKLSVYAYFFENGEKILRCQTYLDTCGHERGVTFTVLFIATRYYLQLCLAFFARLPRTEPHTHRIRSTRTYLSIDCTGGVGETIKRKGMPWQIHISYIGHSQYGQLAAVKTG